MNGLPGVELIKSTSAFGMAVIYIYFDDDVDIYFARQLVLERIFTVSGELPEGTSSNLGPISTGLGEVFQYTLESDERDLMELRSLQDWVLRPILRTVPGVAGVDSFGGHVRQFHVVADPAALRRFGLALEELAAAVAANNGVAGGAFVERGGMLIADLRCATHDWDGNPRQQAALDDQLMQHSVRYWEGAVQVSGSETGRGYLELSGYADQR